MTFDSDSRPVVVLADDNDAEASILKPILEKHGLRVMQATEGTAALELALRLSPRLVIAVLNPPYLDGYQLCQKLREQRHTETVPFMFISPQGVIPDKLVGHQTFASDYVQRPVNASEFENRLRAVLKMHAPVSQGMSSTAEKPVAPTGGDETSADVEKLLAEYRNLRTARSTPPAGPETQAVDEMLAEFRAKSLEGSHVNDDKTPTPAVRSPATIEAMQKPEEKKIEAKADPTVPLDHPVNIDILVRTKVRGRVEVDEIGEAPLLHYKEAAVYVLSCIRRAEAGEMIDARLGYNIACRVPDLLRRDTGLLLLATDRTTEFSPVQHSVNTSIIGTRIAQTLGLPEDRLPRVALSGLVHDIGIIKLPKQLIYKLGAYTATERAEIQRRPIYSAQILTNIPGFEWLPQIVSQVYERENGKGYPNGLEGREICDEAKVLGIADVFEACIHPRPHRPPMTGYQTLEGLTAEGSAFSDRVVKAMIRSFSVYPFNEYVLLNTGEIGKVININTENALRPTVKILHTADGEELYEPKIINLARNSSLYITRAISPQELPVA
jgi:HD-GYP domain-containing protein (c-di-GMP phosphodiesterase class II)/DNA-binding response OmpR family regulator